MLYISYIYIARDEVGTDTPSMYTYPTSLNCLIHSLIFTKNKTKREKKNVAKRCLPYICTHPKTYTKTASTAPLALPLKRLRSSVAPHPPKTAIHPYQITTASSSPSPPPPPPPSSSRPNPDAPSQTRAPTSNDRDPGDVPRSGH